MLQGIGPTELIIILVIVIIIFGVGKLPEIGGALGKGIREFRAAVKETDRADQKPEVPSKVSNGGPTPAQKAAVDAASVAQSDAVAAQSQAKQA